MKTITNILLLGLALVLISCQEEQRDPRIHLRQEVRSDNIVDNIVTRPVAHAFSALIGEGIEITEAITRRNKEVMAVMSWELYEGLLETLEVLSDPELMKHLRTAIETGKPFECFGEIWMPI